MSASLYETDFYEWSLDQAAKLRRLLGERANSELDLENLAEEIESMASSDRRELGNRLEIILIHLLKLAYCFYTDPRQTWVNSVQAQRSSIKKMFKQSPSLKRLADEMLADAYKDALEEAKTETIDLTMRELPLVNPFSLAEVLDRAYVPEPPVRFDAKH